MSMNSVSVALKPAIGTTLVVGSHLRTVLGPVDGPSHRRSLQQVCAYSYLCVVRMTSEGGTELAAPWTIGAPLDGRSPTRGTVTSRHSSPLELILAARGSRIEPLPHSVQSPIPRSTPRLGDWHRALGWPPPSTAKGRAEIGRP